MGYIDLHSKPFDEGTIAKLEIFEQYAQAWIPTFVMQGIENIYIYDFFAGTGYDKNGVKGSPIRVLDVIKNNIGYIFKNKVKINVCLNEFEPNKKSQEKFNLLKKSCEIYLIQNKSVASVVNLELKNEDFESLFPKKVIEIRKNPSLVYLDQNGIKFLSKKYLLELEKMTTTDFLYFTSSSYFKRFGERDEFKQHFEIDVDELKKIDYVNVHRFVINEVKKILPIDTNLKLYPFTIKKGKNIYGIIFGAKHPLAVDKFLNIAWKRNEVNGEANFDIDDEANLGQQILFGVQRISKKEKFHNKLKSKILSLELTSNLSSIIKTSKFG
jgi:three-Cys-motif partner protein